MNHQISLSFYVFTYPNNFLDGLLLRRKISFTSRVIILKTLFLEKNKNRLKRF
ncbi:hypothetical protein SAMN05421793_1641 [Epilithonimonas hominis]|uniref:Uncharacterized protein n=1 Tax=Epilithonimonas hominis TaxID=420404 RepID=A0A1H6MDJ8_9FLAO|nr:hypothetical protein SAMN05421793_1641 [Epilithonimonas hominis]